MVVTLTTETPMEPGNKLQISGIIPEDSQRIQVGLGSSRKDLSFYMDVRFWNNTVVFNTREDGKWGKEIIHANPYKRGSEFEVTVDYTKHNYVVMMGGNTHVTIPNRLNTHRTKQIMMSDDVELHGFSLKPSN
ncbi:galectin-7-like [Engraulis encrasicolus]|uniref:galectin-7-like n=1 Tax=Engraulis encrasicolus TaxID=184585 RepID=UPI002FD71959